MLTVYLATETGVVARPYSGEAALPDNAIWLDLLKPTPPEDKAVEVCVGVSVPTQEDMREIEVSSRLYVEEHARYMTAQVLTGADTENPALTEVTFIVAGKRLVTVRYAEPKAISLYASRMCKQGEGPTSGEAVLIGLLDAIIDRTADILEHTGAGIDDLSRKIFARRPGRVQRKTDYMAILRHIGRQGDLLSMTRESLVSLSRLLGFISTQAESPIFGQAEQSQLQVLSRDAESLRDHTSYLGDKITFLLDAAVGMVTIEQNDLVKLFSVVSVILMPPTLIASTYGMNFQHMPELTHPWGYPIALMAMLISAIVPYVIFRWRHWLQPGELRRAGRR